MVALDRSIIAGAESDEKGGATISKKLPDIDLGQLEELRRAGKVCPPSRDARDAVHDRIETLRRSGHYIRGVPGARGGYVYVRGPNDARVPSPLPQRESEVA